MTRFLLSLAAAAVLFAAGCSCLATGSAALKHAAERTASAADAQ